MKENQGKAAQREAMQEGAPLGMVVPLGLTQPGIGSVAFPKESSELEASVLRTPC